MRREPRNPWDSHKKLGEVRKGLTLCSAGFQTGGLHSCDKISFCCVKLPSWVVRFGVPGKVIQLCPRVWVR